jgi:hypothetical protein
MRGALLRAVFGLTGFTDSSAGRDGLAPGCAAPAGGVGFALAQPDKIR